MGTFKSAKPVTPTIGSYALVGGLSVPILKNKSKIVPNRLPTFLALLPNALLTVYCSSLKIDGLLPHIEQVGSSDLELKFLMTIEEHDLDSVGTAQTVACLLLL